MTTATATNEKLTAALAYAEKLGWAVLPLHSVNADGTCTCGNPECDNRIGMLHITYRFFSERDNELSALCGRYHLGFKR